MLSIRCLVVRRCSLFGQPSVAHQTTAYSTGTDDSSVAELSSFEELLLNLSEVADIDREQALRVADGLQRLGIVTPTRTQREAIPRVLGEGHVVIGAETGSGKTYAYGVPLLCRQPVQLQQRRRKQEGRWPHSIVLVPTAELGKQVAKAIGDVQSDVAVRHWAGVDLSNRFRFAAELPTVDVLVTDPLSMRRALSRPNERLKRAPLVRAGGYVHPLLAKASRLVVDEADMLLDGHFQPIVDDLLTAFRKGTAAPKQPKQVVFAGATFLKGGRASVSAWIEKRYPKATWLRSDQMHRSLPLITHSWRPIDALSSSSSWEDAQVDALVRCAVESIGQGEKVLVFVNTIARAVGLAEQLAGRGLQCKAVHGDQDSAERSDTIGAFSSGSLPVVVSTDLMARGIDLPGRIHVIQADFATSTIIHLHRTGRASRGGVPGRATNFYGEASRQLVEAIRAAEQKHDGDLNHTFSRGRSFARKMKQRRPASPKTSSSSSSSSSSEQPELTTTDEFELK